MDVLKFSTRINAVSLLRKSLPVLSTRKGTAISMDGKGRWMDNVFIERLWKNVKYDDVYLKAYSSMTAARKGLSVRVTI